ncbi:hypothetical protein ACLB2K_010936 [Fragaria x ananassa]
MLCLLSEEVGEECFGRGRNGFNRVEVEGRRRRNVGLSKRVEEESRRSLGGGRRNVSLSKRVEEESRRSSGAEKRNVDIHYIFCLSGWWLLISIICSARLKVRSLTAPAPKKKRGLCSEKKAEDIVAQTGQKIKLQYCPRVKGPSPKYEWDENDKPMFDWILKKAQERYKDWKYQCHKAYLKERPSGMPSDFIGREDQWEFLCEHFELDAFKRLSLANKQNRGEKTMHHHTGSSLIIYTMEELRIQGEQLPIIKDFENTYVRAGDEVTTKHYLLWWELKSLRIRLAGNFVELLFPVFTIYL